MSLPGHLRPRRRVGAPAWRAALALVAAALLAATAQAAPVSITPTTIVITPQRTTELLSLANDSDEPLRFELSVFAWTQSPAGETVLSPTQDIIFFPPLLAVAPGRIAKVRVGTATPFAGGEKSYRVIIQQLPNEANPANAGQIQILTKFSLPLFLEPAGAHPAAVIDSAAFAAGMLDFAVRDAGTAHFVLQRVHAVGSDASGATTFETSADGWYVLAQGRRDYRLAIAESACRRTSRVRIEAITDRGSTQEAVPLAPGGCDSRVRTTAFVAASAPARTP
ncbi:MAG TPA: fimbria/pilus periplasmic chaperone [Alphaproteobacteria bacterium]|nr:fimbria/pilus periplasmic chaperone [Alphaproteobacteria bacterium]